MLAEINKYMSVEQHFSRRREQKEAFASTDVLCATFYKQAESDRCSYVFHCGRRRLDRDGKTAMEVMITIEVMITMVLMVAMMTAAKLVDNDYTVKLYDNDDRGDEW